MIKYIYQVVKYFTSITLVTLLFSCGNDIKEVQDFLAEKNMPIGVAYDVHLIHTDSGRVKTKLVTPLVNDFGNRTEHPYQEFPEGLEVTSYDINGDSVTLMGNYAKTYTKTKISEVKGDVVVINHKDKSRLYTDQLFWDQNTHYVYTEKAFRFYRKLDTLKGSGFESKEDLTKVITYNQGGVVYVKENNIIESDTLK
ncbi:LPS export ABC transporter periplasmic protein LptC [Aureibaculum marinum]|uniref:LPS export ABC transporter periplasmic protein LptC n=1 Tax=Aureibaculum marinum TaxID=2487930 RepID=A0A3N4NWU1_9FLAO|nr:LPS export ABC transporter periplasmic protein LptC [Aureibaculum marinum]RPD96660.1 LPS export ABC transporter periplasmic protein LptC [Aureibaculum marinum]